ncbi:hypothetical protein ACFP6A_14320 [Quadrisphaera sp. GCM10027208]|uniref:hypothetical protein n=1 Tax=Quadrisphaera sp. GCM10027208 TaxID=3273423 RepID=UPI0036234DD8
MARGYSGHDFTSRAELMAADHPEVAERYRAAHGARRRHHDSGDVATTEELRGAIQNYHELVTLLVEGGRRPGHRAPERPDVDRPVSPDDEGRPDDEERPDDEGRPDDEERPPEHRA